MSTRSLPVMLVLSLMALACAGPAAPQPVVTEPVATTQPRPTGTSVTPTLTTGSLIDSTVARPTSPQPVVTEPVAATQPPQWDPPITLALTNGTLIDGTGAEPISHAVVLIAGDRIAAVGAGSEIDIPAGARAIDVNSSTILPGFINAHVHDAYDADRLAAWAQAGVTTVRDEGILGGMSLDEALEVRDALARDPGYARLVSAGHMLSPPHGYGQRDVPSVRAARQVVGDELDRGADEIKFSLEEGYGQWTGLPIFEQDIVDAIVDTAHAHGARASVHICDARYLGSALDAGVDDIAHIQYDYVSDALIQRMIDQHVVVVPTLTVLEAYGSLAGAQANLRRFVEAGVTIAMGNDYTAVPQNGFDHFELGMPMHEIRRMHDAGMTPMQIIIAATRNSARACGLESELGTLEPGKIADILVARGSPLDDLETLLDVAWVVHGGAVIVEGSNPTSETSEVKPMGMFARISGLQRLAERYSGSGESEDETWTGQTLQVGIVRYRRCVDVGASAEGLSLHVHPPMGTHAELLIPWADITASAPSRLYWLPAMRLTIGRPEIATVTVYRNLYARLSSFLSPPT